MGETGKENNDIQESPASKDYWDPAEREKNFDLPDGWKKKITRRMTGRTAESGRNWDVYLIPPKGKRLRSTVELMKFVMANPDVAIDARFVNMERTLAENEKPKMNPSTKKLLQFVEKVKAGETIDKEEYFGKPKPAKTSPSATPTKKPEAVPKQKPVSAKVLKKTANAQKKLLQQHLLQQQLLQQKPLPIHSQLNNPINFAQLLPSVPLAFNLYNQQALQPRQLGKKNQLLPSLFDFLSTATSDSMPAFTITQAIKMERLLLEHPDVPTPDQISEWSSELGINYTDMQEWIRIKWYAKLSSQSSDSSFNDVTMEDEEEEDPLADDVINPAALCNVVMED